MVRYKEFGDRVRFAMDKRGLRNSDVVSKYKELFNIQVTSSQVSHLRYGRTAPSEKVLSELSTILGVDKEWLEGYGSIQDFTGGLEGAELKDAVKRISKVFSTLRPDLQRLMLDFVDVLEEISSQEKLFFQHIKSNEEGVPLDLDTHINRVRRQYIRYKKR